jgi:colanic acid/amylovoran biosynthesis glycosyltransferase
MKVAYLINEYPTPSHTFIQREIAALENGDRRWNIVRYASRRPKKPAVDEKLIEESRQTHYLLGGRRGEVLAGTFKRILSMIPMAIAHPVGFVRGLRLALKLGWPSGGTGPLVHLMYFAQACTLYGWAKRDDVRHVHAHFGKNPSTLAALLHAMGGPTFSFTVHGPDEFDAPVGLSLAEKVKRSSFTAAISSFCRSQLWRWSAHEDWSKVIVVHCPVSDDYFHHPIAPLPAQKRFVHVGRLAPQKGQGVLVRAVAMLKKEGLDFEIAIIGEDEVRGVVKAQIDAYDVADRIKCLGQMTNAQVRVELDRSRGMVMASFAEGLPVVIMESLARHRPVISTSIAGIPELVRHGENGWLVPAGDDVALAAALRAAINASDEQLLKMGAAGAALVKQNHDAATEAAKLSEKFAELTKQSGI